MLTLLFVLQFIDTEILQPKVWSKAKPNTTHIAYIVLNRFQVVPCVWSGAPSAAGV